MESKIECYINTYNTYRNLYVVWLIHHLLTHGPGAACGACDESRGAH